MEARFDRAQALLEALPYLRRFAGKTLVLKFGGSAMTDDSLRREFARDVVLLKYVGLNPLIVHGGGPQIGAYLKRLGQKSEFVSGLRVTPAETLQVVEMVLRGTINPEIVGLINAAGGKAVGICGKDGGLVRARRLLWEELNPRPEKKTDLGFVGEIEDIATGLIQALEGSGHIAVVAPIGADESGQSYNLNADHLAGRLAGALRAEKLIVLTDVEGIKDREGGLIPSLPSERLHRAIAEGWISEGMIPKTQACLQALAGGVKKTHIIDGRVPHALLLEIFTREGIGTEIVQ